jgi:hypothetical protein
MRSETMRGSLANAAAGTGVQAYWRNSELPRWVTNCLCLLSDIVPPCFVF